MLPLWKSVAKLATNLHPDRVEIIAVRIEKLSGPHEANLLSSQEPSPEVAELIRQLVISWDENPEIGPMQLSAAMRSSAATFSEAKDVYGVQSLVWTGPDTNLVPVRRSEQVLLEVIGSAEESLFLVSFVLVSIPGIESAIEDAVSRGVDVRMLLESEDKNNSASFQETVDRVQTSIPGITIYVWPRNKRESIEGGFARVHAKCVVADKKNAFLTSANLTSAALDKNIEMGVLTRGGNLPTLIHEQFLGLVRAREIVPFRNAHSGIPSKSAVVPLAEIDSQLKPGTGVLVSFRNEKLAIDEERKFRVLDPQDEMPKANSVVIIHYKNSWLIGKYAWSKQQDTDSSRNFYLVIVRGFSPTKKIEIEEEDWSQFRPIAVEVV